MKRISIWIIGLLCLLAVIWPEHGMGKGAPRPAPGSPESAPSGGKGASVSASLQQMIDAAPAGAVIKLPAQTFAGNVVIDKPCQLIGTDGTTIRGDGTGNVITIRASHVLLERLVVEHGGTDRNSAEEYAAVKVSGATDTTIKSLFIADSYHGIYLKNSDGNVIENVTVQGAGSAEIASQGNGIQLVHANRNKLVNNKITGTRDGIYFYYADHNLAEGNRISGTRYGLHYMYANGNRFWANRFTGNIGGAAIMLSRNIELSANQFSGQNGTQAFGILLKESENVQIGGNHFSENQRGLYIDNSFNYKITGNTFAHNKIGVEIWASAANGAFSQNRFVRNAVPVVAVGGAGTNAWSEHGRGNLWAEEPALDLNRDGLGDVPVQYKSSLGRLIKESELVYLFLGSPSVRIYEEINRLLNRQDIMFTDPHPLAERAGIHPAAIFAAVAGAALLSTFYVIRRKRRWG
ncbi:MAG TPA: nitrous oxide reductase family maturation protein NosD [Bacilli bacterium]